MFEFLKFLFVVLVQYKEQDKTDIYVFLTRLTRVGCFNLLTNNWWESRRCIEMNVRTKSMINQGKVPRFSMEFHISRNSSDGKQSSYVSKA